MRGVELFDVKISGELRNVVVNGVDLAPLVDAELNRRMPERGDAPEGSDRFRRSWQHRRHAEPDLTAPEKGN